MIISLVPSKFAVSLSRTEKNGGEAEINPALTVTRPDVGPEGGDLTFWILTKLCRKAVVHSITA